MYDLIILGGGPAGYNAAERAGHAGLKTLVIEERALGGVCLNEGCIPTKTLLYSAKIYDYAKHGKDYGVTFGSASIDHAFVVERKNKVVKQLVSGVGAKMKKCGVEVVKGSTVVRRRNVAKLKAGRIAGILHTVSTVDLNNSALVRKLEDHRTTGRILQVVFRAVAVGSHVG